MIPLGNSELWNVANKFAVKQRRQWAGDMDTEALNEWQFTNLRQTIEVFSPDAFVEGEDDQGCGGDRGDGSGIEGDVLEGLEVLDQGVGPLGGSPH